MIRLGVLITVCAAGAVLAWREGELMIAAGIAIGGIALALLRLWVPRPPKDD